MKKISCLLLATLTASMMLFGCGDSDENTTSQNSAPTEIVEMSALWKKADVCKRRQ